jgi:hypothetical protein
MFCIPKQNCIKLIGGENFHTGAKKVDGNEEGERSPSESAIRRGHMHILQWLSGEGYPQKDTGTKLFGVS